MSSRGQGHAFCARRPRIVSPTIHPTLKGSDNKVGPFRAERFKSNADRGFHPRLFMSLPYGEHANHNARCPAKDVGHDQLPRKEGGPPKRDRVRGRGSLV